MLYNTENSFGIIAKIFHWLMAVLIINMLIIGFVMIGMTDGELKKKIYYFHKSIGFFALVLATIRFIWRTINIIPQLLKTVPAWHKLTAEINIKLLYLLLFLVPISGLGMSLLGGFSVKVLDLFTIPAIIADRRISSIMWLSHYALAVMLGVLIVVHVSGALYHHFVRKDDVLKQMF